MLLRRPDLACSCLLRKRLCCYISFSIYSNYKSYMWCTWFVFIVCLIVLHAWSCFIGFISQPLNCYRTCFELLPDVQGALCRSLSAGVCPQPMQYQLGTDLEQICELQIDGHLFEAFCNSLRSEAHAGRLTVSARRCHTAKPMPLQRCRFEGDGAQSGPPCPECGPPISSGFSVCMVWQEVRAPIFQNRKS